ncbi:hypothetical protein INR49_020830 [Caranx melampygus]|nr:hypothetical protein INR49_020830 [Caranx melampygus]
MILARGLKHFDHVGDKNAAAAKCRRCDVSCSVMLHTNRVWMDNAQLEAQKATQDFQRATEVLRAAKETISLAEQRLLEEDNRQFDSAWQEMLNHATQRVRRGEEERGRGGEQQE